MAAEIQHKIKEYNAQTNSNLNMVFVSFKKNFADRLQ